MDCCEATNEAAAAQSKSAAVCGACGMKARKAERATVEHVVNRGPQNEITDTQYYFCDAPSCDVVYFSNDSAQYFRKKDVRVRVGIKETADPIPICYCFDHTMASAREEIARTGGSTVVAGINAEIRAGNCACELKNPLGRCCLGEVSKVVRALLGECAVPVTGEAALEAAFTHPTVNPTRDCCAPKDSGTPATNNFKQ